MSFLASIRRWIGARREVTPRQPCDAVQAWTLLCASRNNPASDASQTWCRLHGLKPMRGPVPEWWQLSGRVHAGRRTTPWDKLIGLPVCVTRDRDGAPMVLVPGGSFLMGWTEEDRRWVAENQAKFGLRTDNKSAQQRLVLSPFYLDAYPVTRRRYGMFSKSMRDPGPRDDHPVAYVTWHEARTYAQWVGADLPTEAQWERAARGDRNCRYPWGNEPPDESRANFEDRFAGTTPVRRFPPNPFGLHDMAGNVYDWCFDWYRDDNAHEARVRDPSGPRYGATKLLRGASYTRWADDDQALVHCAFRHESAPSDARCSRGFRCAIALHAQHANIDKRS